MQLPDQAWTRLGRDPVPGPAPAGENVRYEEDYIRLGDEVGKMRSAGPTAVDWPAVVEMASTILSARSKDLLVASWLAFALQREDGVKGLTAGLQVVRGIAEGWWEDCFPPASRARARVAAIEWIVGRAGPSLSDMDVSPDNAEEIAELFEVVADLDRILSEKTGGQGVDLGDLMRPLRALKRNADFVAAERAAEAKAAEAEGAEAAKAEAGAVEAVAEATAGAEAAETAAPGIEAVAPADRPAETVPAPAPDAQPAPTAVSAPAPVAPPPPTVVAVPVTPGPEMNRAVNALRANVIDVAKAIRSAAPQDPRSYQLLRSVLWLAVQAPPPDQGGRTMLPDPTGASGPILSALAGAGESLKLLEFCESSAIDHLFWLDLHRHAAEVLGALGYVEAQEVLVVQTAAFLKRFPTIAELAFESGTAFADSATRAWIAHELLSGDAPGDGGAGTGIDADFDEVRSDARALAAGGRLGEAAAALDGARDRAAGERARFLWDIEKARLCIDAGRNDLAMSLLAYLDDVASMRALDAWDPSVCADLTVLLLRGSAPGTAADSDPEWAARRRNWKQRLSRLHLRSAIELAEARDET